MPETTAKKPQKATTAAQKPKAKGKVAAPAKTPTAPLPPHRPSDYSDEIADEICWRLTHGEPLVQMCKDDHLPHVATIYRWLIRHTTFRDMYAQAREEQADTNADEILSIADEMPPQFTDEKGRVYLDQSYLLWQKQRIEARKWTAAKLKPRKYGDKLALGGDADAPPIKTEETSSNRLFDIIRNLEMTKRAG